MIKLSVIILTRNRSKLLTKCLKSIIKYHNKTTEIIVINNASTDNTKKILKQFKDIITIDNKKNFGVAAGRNICIKKAKGEIIMFLDDDAYIEKNPFPKIIDYMKKNPDIGIIGPKLLYPNGKLQESVRQFPTLLPIIWRGSVLSKIFPEAPFYKRYVLSDFDHNHIKEIDWVMGACFVVRKKLFEEIGNFDKRFFLVYDDIDFCYRAKKAGWKVIYYPYSIVYHRYSRESAKGLLTKAKLEHIKSILYFFYKIYLRKDYNKIH